MMEDTTTDRQTDRQIRENGKTNKHADDFRLIILRQFSSQTDRPKGQSKNNQFTYLHKYINTSRRSQRSCFAAVQMDDETRVRTVHQQPARESY